MKASMVRTARRKAAVATGRRDAFTELRDRGDDGAFGVAGSRTLPRGCQFLPMLGDVRGTGVGQGEHATTRGDAARHG